ncbi:unnamed protein product [Ilex paraguariensis]|uniref:Uncharacterized protein n=1 Tax=Ilex paraguariensis TaxID=185542 RepID=A0ABC8T6N4_9AQUA
MTNEQSISVLDGGCWTQLTTYARRISFHQTALGHAPVTVSSLMHLSSGAWLVPGGFSALMATTLLSTGSSLVEY